MQAFSGSERVGAIVCKLDTEKDFKRGYIAMLAVDNRYRKRGIGTALVSKVIIELYNMNCSEVFLETEITNRGSLALYENLGFIRDKRLHKYYLNGIDAFRLKLYLR